MSSTEPSHPTDSPEAQAKPPPASSTGAPAKQAKPSPHQPEIKLFRRTVSFRDASIEMVLTPGGRLRRYVVLNSKKLQLELGQPHRREIEPLLAQQEHFHLRTSELWTIAEDQAQKFLRKIYESLPGRRDEPSAPSVKPATRLQPLGHVIPTEAATDSARGQLLFAGPTNDGSFCVEVLEEGRRVRSITGIDLARALQVADVDVGDTIVIERDGHHEVAIREERSGTHGADRRTIHRKRETFKVTKERGAEEHSGVTLLPRSVRSIPSAS